MAPKITSSSNRRKRTSTKPVTQGQNPQRANRQSVSKAKVTDGNARKATGTAKVTGGTPAKTRGTGPALKLPNGTNPAQLKDKAKGVDILRAQGGAQNSRTANATRAANAPKPRPSGNFKAPNIPKGAGKAAAGLGIKGALGTVGNAALIGTTLAEILKIGRNIKDQQEQTRKDKVLSKTLPATDPQAAKGYVRLGQGGAPAYQPGTSPAPTKPRSPAASAPVHAAPRSAYAPQVGQAPRPNAPQPAAQPAQPGQQWKDFNPNRGTSLSNNPMLDRMGLREGMAKREAANAPQTSPQYEGNDEPGRLGQQEGGQAGSPKGFDPQSVVEEMLRRKKLTISMSN